MIGCHAFNRRLAVSSERRLTPGQTCKSGHCAGSTHLGLAVVADLHEKTAATNARPGDSGRACSHLARRLAEPGGEYDPSTLPALAAQYGCEVDFEATMPLVERHNLVF